jgi:hypothetical protein
MSNLQLALFCAVGRKVRDQYWDDSVDHQWCILIEYLRRCRVHAENVLFSKATVRTTRHRTIDSNDMDAPITSSLRNPLPH